MYGAGLYVCFRAYKQPCVNAFHPPLCACHVILCYEHTHRALDTITPSPKIRFSSIENALIDPRQHVIECVDLNYTKIQHIYFACSAWVRILCVRARRVGSFSCGGAGAPHITQLRAYTHATQHRTRAH